MIARNRRWFVRLAMSLFTSLIRLQPVQADRLLEDGDSLDAYGLPGHSPGSTCLLLEDGSGFVGDLVSTTGQPHLQSELLALIDAEQ